MVLLFCLLEPMQIHISWYISIHSNSPHSRHRRTICLESSWQWPASLCQLHTENFSHFERKADSLEGEVWLKGPLLSQLWSVVFKYLPQNESQSRPMNLVGGGGGGSEEGLGGGGFTGIYISGAFATCCTVQRQRHQQQSLHSHLNEEKSGSSFRLGGSLRGCGCHLSVFN